MSIFTYNGGAIIAMSGKDCIGIASDTRLGIQFQTVACDFQKVFKMSNKIFLGLGGLATDVQTLERLLKFRKNLYELREERDISPRAFADLLSNILYEKRFGSYFVEPIVAGLDAENKPFLVNMDCIGAPCETKDYTVAGTCSANMHGMCETLWKEGMEPEELFETLSQALLASVDRDAISGWGATVHIVTKDGVMSRELKARQD